jgi:hypothetical protein
MTETAASPSGPRGPNDESITYRNPVAAHPITSVAIGLLLTVTILGTLIVPIYARSTPKIGDFPFFYFYLLAYMPFVGLALWVVSLLQRRVQPPAGSSDDMREAAR